MVRDMGIAGLNLKFNKKVKTNVERESIFFPFWWLLIIKMDSLSTLVLTFLLADGS